MTVPIARLVATRYADAERAAAPLLPGQRLPRGAPAARPDARVRPGRGRADRRAGAGRDRRGDRGAGGGARRRRPRPRRDRARRRRPLPPAARPSSASRARRATRSSPGSRPTTWSASRLELSELPGIGDEQVRDLRRPLAAARRQRGARARPARSAAPRSSGRPRGSSETYEALDAPRRRRPGPDRPRPAARPRLLQRRDPRGLRPGRSATCSAAAAATTACCKRFGVDLPAAGFALYLERVHVAQMEESRAGGSSR